jgi:hypothetical protein
MDDSTYLEQSGMIAKIRNKYVLWIQIYLNMLQLYLLQFHILFYSPFGHLTYLLFLKIN